MHYDSTTGVLCACPWAEDDLWFRLAGKKIDYFKAQGDKKLDTPEGKALIKWLEEQEQTYPQLDGLAPFLLKEFKQNRILGPTEEQSHREDPQIDLGYPNNPRWTYFQPGLHGIEWHNWLRSQAPNRQGVDITKKNFSAGDLNELMPDYRKWDQQQRDYATHKEGLKGGEVIHRFPDGWHIKQLTDRDHCVAEGHMMRNCIKDYDESDLEQRDLLSLRDDKNIPHVSMEFRQGEGEALPLPGRASRPWDQVTQIYGGGNSVPKEEYKDRIKQWMETMPHTQRPLSRNYNDDWDDDGYREVHDIHDLRNMHDEAADRQNQIEDQERQLDLGGATDVPTDEYGFPLERPNKPKKPLDIAYHWPGVFDSLVDPNGGYQGYGLYHGGEATEVYNHALQHGKIPEMASEFEPWEQEKDEEFFDNQANNYYPYSPGDLNLKEPEEEDYEDPAEHERAYEKFQEEYQEKQQEAEQHDTDHAYEQWAYGKMMREMGEKLRPHVQDDPTTGQRTWSQEPVQAAPVQARTARHKTKAERNRPHVGIDGDPCHCGYGGESADTRTLLHNREFYGRTVTAKQIDYLRKRPDMQADKWMAGPYLLRMFENNANYNDPKFDRYLPWIVREIKAGRLSLPRHLTQQITKMEEIKEARDMGFDKIDNYPYGPTPLDALESSHRSYADSYADQFSFTVAGRDEHHVPENVTKSHMGRLHDWYDYHRKRQNTPNLEKKDETTHARAVFDAAKAHEDDQDENFRKNGKHGTTMHDFGDGWKMKFIGSAREARLEGKDMTHCIGNDTYSYPRDIEAGKSFNLSLRDEHNKPHATIEIQPSRVKHKDADEDQHNYSEGYPGHKGWLPVLPGSDVTQIQGRNDNEPYGEAVGRIQDFLNHNDLHYNRGNSHGHLFNDDIDEYGNELDEYGDPVEERPEQWWDDYYTTPGAANVDEYLAHADGDYEYPEEYDRARMDYDAWGEEHGYENYTEPDLEVGDPEFEDVFEDTQPTGGYVFQNGQLPTATPAVFDANRADSLYTAAADRGHVPEFEQEFKDWKDRHLEEGYNLTDEDDAELKQWHDWWDNTFAKNYHPETGAWETPIARYNPRAPNFRDVETAYDRWWANGGQEQYANRLPAQLPGFEDWDTDQQPSMQQVKQVMSRVEIATPPIYYRWVFSPGSGEVELAHNDEAHPTDVRTHGDLARGRGEANLQHGYAYRIGGGWRLTDWEHQPVSDPYIVAQVMNRLNAQDPFRPSPKEASGPAWDFFQPDFDNLHNGIPSNL